MTAGVFPRRAFGVVAVLALFALSCDEDPVRPDVTEAPTIGSVSPAEWTIQSGDVTIEVSVPQAEAVTFHVDDQFVDMIETAPFQFTWRSADFPNGPHTIRAAAFNRLGSTSTSRVLVSNNPGKGIAVLVEPREVVVDPRELFQFEATVLGTEDDSVTWSLETPIQGSSLWGGIHPEEGLYGAPDEVPVPPNVTVVARSVADPTKSATALVRIEPFPITISP
jgi:hypothetical protein